MVRSVKGERVDQIRGCTVSCMFGWCKYVLFQRWYPGCIQCLILLRLTKLPLRSVEERHRVVFSKAVLSK